MRRPGPRDGMATGDALLVLATLALVFAVAYPRIERVATLNTAAEAEYAVESVRAAAAEFRTTRGAWPDAAPSGEVPPELTPHLPGDFAFQSSAFSLKWERWERVEEPPPDAIPEAPELPPSANTTPPDLALDSVPRATARILPLAGITVTCDDDRVLAALLDRYGPEQSFVRANTWTLVLVGADGDSPDGP